MTPVSIYEVHLDSWMRVPEEWNRPLNCVEIGAKLAGYARRMNFTHVELLSVGAPERRIMGQLIDDLYKNEIGVIIESDDSPDLDNWDRAWATDTLAYLGQDPLFRKYHHNHLACRAGEILQVRSMYGSEVISVRRVGAETRIGMDL